MHAIRSTWALKIHISRMPFKKFLGIRVCRCIVNDHASVSAMFFCDRGKKKEQKAASVRKKIHQWKSGESYRTINGCFCLLFYTGISSVSSIRWMSPWNAPFVVYKYKKRVQIVNSFMDVAIMSWKCPYFKLALTSSVRRGKKKALPK